MALWIALSVVGMIFLILIILAMAFFKVSKRSDELGESVTMRWIELDSVSYQIVTKKTRKETENWLNKYARHGVVCESCGALIFPHYPIGKIGDQYYHSGAFPCAPRGTEWGVIDAGGNPVSTRKSGLTFDEEVQKNRMAIVENIDIPMPSLDECDYLLYGVSILDTSRNYG